MKETKHTDAFIEQWWDAKPLEEKLELVSKYLSKLSSDKFMPHSYKTKELAKTIFKIEKVKLALDLM